MKKVFILICILSLILVGCTAPTPADDNPPQEEMSNEAAMDEKPASDNKDTENDMAKDETMASEDNMEKDDSKDMMTEKVIGVEDIELALNQKAPDFTLETISGEVASLSDYQGQYVIATFWATWCTYCRQELPHLNTLDKEADDIKVITINQSESRTKVETYLREENIDLEVFMDFDGKVGNKYLVQGLPTNYFFDKEGNLISSYPGMLTEEDLEKVVEYMRENF